MIKEYFRNIWFEFKYMCRELWAWNWGSRTTGVQYHAYNFWRDIYHPLRVMKYGIENLFAYFKVIWFERDWDYYFLEQLMMTKFRRMKKNFELYGHHTNVNTDIKRINFILKCLERIEKDEYRPKMKAEHKVLYGEPKFNFIPQDFDKKGKPLTSRLEINYPNCKTSDENETADQHHRRIDQLCEADKQRDYRLLFKVWAKYHQSFWD